VLVERGEHINLNFSYRFTAEAFHELLTERAGLRVLEQNPQRGWEVPCGGLFAVRSL
jgi:hypothetical protein